MLLFPRSQVDKYVTYPLVTRKCVAADAAKQLVHAFTTSRLDNGNSLLYGLPPAWCASMAAQLYISQETELEIEWLQALLSYFRCSALWTASGWIHALYKISFLHSFIYHLWSISCRWFNMQLQELSDVPGMNHEVSASQALLLTVDRTRLDTYGNRAFSVAGSALVEWTAAILSSVLKHYHW